MAGTAGESWIRFIRGAPAGLLALSALLAVVGGGLVAGGVYFAFWRPGGGWIPVAIGLVGGPLAIYVARNLLRLRHWAWLVMVLLTLLLLLSSVWRLAVAPGLPVSPLVETIVEILVLAYLGRPRLRAALRAA